LSRPLEWFNVPNTIRKKHEIKPYHVHDGREQVQPASDRRLCFYEFEWCAFPFPDERCRHPSG